MTIAVGQRVRLLDMRGCMATVRHNEREGNVTAIVPRTPYGSSQPVNYLVILMDDGTQESAPYVPRLWTLYNGLMEYRDA